uniref:TIL domain-containing protein n=1 Tax=Anopheles farauti TaxID=69004 RepID=A0A1Y9HB88_9DIPT
MERVRVHRVVSAIVFVLLLEPTWNSLIYDTLHFSTPWLRNHHNRWNVLVRWYPWLYMIDRSLIASSGIHCQSNETYVKLGRPCGSSCGTYGQMCPFVRLNRCVCIRGHVRNERGRCIHYTECTKSLDDVEFLH